MRLSSLILICIITGAFFLGSCQRNSVTPGIVGKWTLTEAIGDYTVYGVNRKDTARYTSADYFEFKADSTIAILVTGTAYNGRWTISNSKLYVTGTNYIDFPHGFDITILTANDLQLHNAETNSISTLDQKMNLKR